MMLAEDGEMEYVLLGVAIPEPVEFMDRIDDDDE